MVNIGAFMRDSYKHKNIQLAVKTLNTRLSGYQKLEGLVLAHERELANFLTFYGLTDTLPDDGFTHERHGCRALYFEDAVKKTNYSSILSLGAGLSTYGLGHDKLKKFEIDFDEVISFKRTIYQEIGIDIGQDVNFIQGDLNFIQLPLLIPEESLILDEGISYFLKPKTNEKIFRTAARKGSSIIIDYFIEGMKNGTTGYEDGDRHAINFRNAGNKFQFTVDPQNLSEIVGYYGLKVDKDKNNKDKNTSMTDLLDKYGKSHNPWVYIAELSPRIIYTG